MDEYSLIAIIFITKMSEYRKTILQPPKSYDQLNKNRPTKRKIYNYSQSESQPEPMPKPSSRPTATNCSWKYNKQFSFEHSDSPPKTKETHRELDIKSKYNSSPQGYKKRQPEPYQSPSKKYDIDQRLNNISSINDKITGLLNFTRSKKKQETLSSPPKQTKYGSKNERKESAPGTFTSRYYYDQSEESKVSRAKPFRSKYAYTPDEDPIAELKKDLASKYGSTHHENSYSYKSAVPQEKKYDFDRGVSSRTAQYTSKLSEYPPKDVSVTPYKEIDVRQSEIPSSKV